MINKVNKVLLAATILSTGLLCLLLYFVGPYIWMFLVLNSGGK